jgi:hypothetical protein
VARSAPHRVLLAVACGVAVVGFAAACGGSSSSPSTAAAGASGGSSSTSAPTTTSGGGGISGSSFCDVARKWKAQLPNETKALTNLGSGPAYVKAVYSKLGQDFQALIAVAPSDIKPSLQVLDADFVKLNQILAKANYNVVQAAPELAKNRQLFNSPATKTAEKKLKAWANTNSCNLSGG